MSQRLLKTIVILLVLNLAFLVLMYGQADWITKINGDKITKKEFNDAYKGVVIFGSINSPKPLTNKQINELLVDKEKKELYLRNFQDEYLIIQKAKEKGLYDEKDVEKKAKAICGLIKRQIIVKQFVNKYIIEKVKNPSSKEVNDLYTKERKKFGDAKPKDAKAYIKEQLKAQKIQRKYKRYLENLRLKSKIITKDF